MWVVAPPSPEDPGQWAEPGPDSVFKLVEYLTLTQNRNGTRIMWVNSQTFEEKPW